MTEPIPGPAEHDAEGRSDRSFVRVVAVDFDGTIAESDRVAPDVLAAIAETRAEGRRVVLVTGRILSELRRVFPDVLDHFDAIVAENGAVLSSAQRGERPLHQPVPRALADALEERGIPLTRGVVLLALDGAWEAAVLEETRRMGLECQLVRNREALMVLPAGASKGHGLYVALGVLGVSHHNAIAFGDAENDHSLLEGCELGIAVDNAVPGLKARADIVLKERNGAGVASFLRGPVVREGMRVLPARWQVEIGRYADGFPVAIPASQINLLIAGETATGKSWLAGLIAERLIEAEYSICVLDPEGDHPGLGRLRGVTMLGGPEGAPSITEIRRNLQHRFGSVVVDASALAVDDKPPFYIAALEEIEAQRRANGLPHWVFLDEAQLPAGGEITRFRRGTTAAKGFCLVTWRPEDLDAAVLDDVDLVMLTSALARNDGLAWLPERFHPREAAALLQTLRPSEALLLAPGIGGGPRVFRTGARTVTHVRHWHKYMTSRLPEHRRFHFVIDGGMTGRSAANLAEFHHEVQRAPAGTLLHHAANRDFSRWIAEVIRDDSLAATISGIESRLPPYDPRAAEAIRAGVLEAIRERYLEEGGAARR